MSMRAFDIPADAKDGKEPKESSVRNSPSAMSDASDDEVNLLRVKLKEARENSK